jgi:hypothetical protein
MLPSSAPEQQVRPLSELPERVTSLETQFLQFRTEVREEFSAVRSEIQLVRSEMRFEIRAGDEALLGEIRKVEASLRREIQGGRRGNTALHARAPRGCDYPHRRDWRKPPVTCGVSRSLLANWRAPAKLVEEIQEKNNVVIGCWRL